MPRHNGHTVRIRQRDRRHWLRMRGLLDLSAKSQAKDKDYNPEEAGDGR